MTPFRFARRQVKTRARRSFWLLAASVLGAVPPPPALATEAEPEIVQCLLPTAPRRLGPIAYLPQRRIVAVTVERCGRMSGETISPEQSLAISESQMPLMAKPDGGM